MTKAQPIVSTREYEAKIERWGIVMKNEGNYQIQGAAEHHYSSSELSLKSLSFSISADPEAPDAVAGRL